MNTSTLPQIYTPSAAEIAQVCASAKRRHPDLAARLDKAAELLTSGAVTLDTVAWERGQLARWKVASQSGRGAYVVVGLACPCKDRQCNGVSHCKHAAAVALLSKILTNHFNQSVRARDIDLGILPDGTFSAWAKGMGAVHVKRLGSGYIFCDAASMVRYAIWAAKQPLSIEWPTMAQVAA